MQQVAATIVHPGKYNDRLPEADHAYGIVDTKSKHVPDCLTNENFKGGFKSKLNEFKEEIYQSNKKYPLVIQSSPGQKARAKLRISADCSSSAVQIRSGHHQQ